VCVCVCERVHDVKSMLPLLSNFDIDYTRFCVSQAFLQELLQFGLGHPEDTLG